MSFLRSLVGTLVLLLLLVPLVGQTDSLVIPDISNQPGAVPDNTPRPARAMTMEQVRDEFGSPRKIMGPVGSPPITRWIYDDFVVTFEHKYVIHSAAKRNK